MTTQTLAPASPLSALVVDDRPYPALPSPAQVLASAEAAGPLSLFERFQIAVQAQVRIDRAVLSALAARL